MLRWFGDERSMASTEILNHESVESKEFFMTLDIPVHDVIFLNYLIYRSLCVINLTYSVITFLWLSVSNKISTFRFHVSCTIMHYDYCLAAFLLLLAHDQHAGIVGQ